MFRLGKKKSRQVDHSPSRRVKRLMELDSTIDFSRFSERRSGGDLVMRMPEHREGFSKNLLRTREAAVAHTCFPDGGEFSSHTHKEFEYILVYRGRMVIHFGDGKDKEISKGVAICVKPNEEHGATIDKGTCMIAVTMPPSPDWPNEGDDDD